MYYRGRYNKWAPLRKRYLLFCRAQKVRVEVKLIKIFDMAGFIEDFFNETLSFLPEFAGNQNKLI